MTRDDTRTTRVTRLAQRAMLAPHADSTVVAGARRGWLWDRDACAKAAARSRERRAGGRRVTVVWSNDDAAAPAMIAVPAAGTVRVIGMLGEDLGTSPFVPVSGRPVYVVEGP